MTTLEELSNIVYNDEINYIDEYGKEIKIFKNKYNFSANDLRIINQFAYFYNLGQNEKEYIKQYIHTFIWCNTIIKLQNNVKLDLKSEAKKIYEAIDTLAESKIFKNDEPNYDDCYQILKKRYKMIADDLESLSQEKYTIVPNNKETNNNKYYIYEVVKKYKNLNPLVVLSAFKQSQKILATELVFKIIKYLKNLNIENNKNTKITKNTINLINELFGIKVNARDLSKVNDIVSITRYFIPNINPII